jgi:hypothetical protein
MAVELHKWEQIWADSSENRPRFTNRMRVPGGWLYRHTVLRPEGKGTIECIAFVPGEAEPGASSRE